MGKLTNLNIGTTYPIKDGLKSMYSHIISQRPQAKSRVEICIFYKIPSDLTTKDRPDSGFLQKFLQDMIEQFLDDTYVLTRDNIGL